MLNVKDSGARREFATGAVRDIQDGKGRYDLIPYGPLQRLAVVFELGAKKYGVYNWQKGIPVSSFIDSAMRHLQKAKVGLVDEDHAAMAVWNIMCMMWTLDAVADGSVPKDTDDRTEKIPEDGCQTLTYVLPVLNGPQCVHRYVEESRYTDSSGTHVTECCNNCGAWRARLEPIVY